MKRITLDYLCKNRHGRNLVRLMSELALKGSMNMYELAKVSGLSYALVHKSTKELSRNGFLHNYGKRHIERKPGQKRQNKYKHETILWGLSIPGIWMLVRADKKILAKWDEVKVHYNELLGTSLEYFDLMFEIGVIRSEYGYSTRHNHPNPKMVAQALLFLVVANEKRIVDRYNRAVRLLEEYPMNVSRRILYKVRKEIEIYSKLLNRCKVLQEKIEGSYYRRQRLEEQKKLD